MASEPLFTDEEYQWLLEVAQRRGFDSVSDYVMDLVEADAEGADESYIDDSGINIVESIRRGLEDIAAGRVMSVAEMWERLDEDNDEPDDQ